MLITIEYCSVWNYLPNASSLEAELRKNFQNIEIKLISGGGGVFEVSLDKNLIFSKKSLGRFPKQSEIVDIIVKKTS